MRFVWVCAIRGRLKLHSRSFKDFVKGYEMKSIWQHGHTMSPCLCQRMVCPEIMDTFRSLEAVRDKETAENATLSFQ